MKERKGKVCVWTKERGDEHGGGVITDEGKRERKNGKKIKESNKKMI